MFKLKRNQHGLAAIELTLILPILLLLIFATAEFSRVLYQYNALTKVVRNASRYIISHAGASNNVVDITAQTSNNTTALLTYGDLQETEQILPNLAASTISVSVSGKFITITASYPWQPLFFTSLPTFVSSNSIDLSFPLVTTYTMRAL